MQYADNLSLAQRKRVSGEIAKEYRKWRRTKGEPTEAERKQIVRIGYEIARRKDPKIAAAGNPRPDYAFVTKSPSHRLSTQWAIGRRSARELVAEHDHLRGLGWKMGIAKLTNPREKFTPGWQKPTAWDARVDVWEERDRLHIALVDKRNEKLIADWWDDDARQMFEDGFFESGRGLESSVIKYAEDRGLLRKRLGNNPLDIGTALISGAAAGTAAAMVNRAMRRNPADDPVNVKKVVRQVTELYRLALKQTGGDKERALAMVEAYLAGQSGLFPAKAIEKIRKMRGNPLLQTIIGANPMKEYAVFRYRYAEMKEPKWSAVDTSWRKGDLNWRDLLPPSVLADPGILAVFARTKTEAIESAKRRYGYKNNPLLQTIIGANPTENASRKELYEATREVGLYIATYSPGDGTTRYRFFKTPTNYFAGDGIYTALGLKEAWTFLEGYRRHNPFRIKMKPETIERRRLEHLTERKAQHKRHIEELRKLAAEDPGGIWPDLLAEAEARTVENPVVRSLAPGSTRHYDPTAYIYPSHPATRLRVSYDLPGQTGLTVPLATSAQVEDVLENPAGAYELAQQFVAGATTGRAGAMYIHGACVYSYGPHFPLACREADGTISITTQRPPSKTTAVHLGAVRRAASEAGVPTQAKDLGGGGRGNPRPLQEIFDLVNANIRIAKSAHDRGDMESLYAAMFSVADTLFGTLTPQEHLQWQRKYPDQKALREYLDQKALREHEIRNPDITWARRGKIGHKRGLPGMSIYPTHPAQELRMSYYEPGDPAAKAVSLTSAYVSDVYGVPVHTIPLGGENPRKRKTPWCRGYGMRGLRVVGYPGLDRCPICGAVFVKNGRIPVHREGVGDPRIPAHLENPPTRRETRAQFVRETVAPKGQFDPRSFRVVPQDGHRVVIGCPKGSWDPVRKVCKIGTRAHAILHPMKKNGKVCCNPLTTAERGVLAMRSDHWESQALKQPKGSQMRAYGIGRALEGKAISSLLPKADNPSKFSIGRGPTKRVLTSAQARRMMKNPMGKRRKVTMPLKKFAAMLQKQGDPEMIRAFQKKIEGYRKWTHGTLPKTVTVETVDVPGVKGLWITYDAGKEPEALYVMPKGAKRGGAWRHEWETMPALKHDPEAGVIIKKLGGTNRMTDFLHG